MLRTNNKQQAMTSNKHAIGVCVLGGARPQARTRTNCRATLGHIDRHIVAWAAAHGHRHRPVDNSNYFLRCLNSAVLVWEIVGCQFNNGGKNGITIRLHSLGYRRLGQRPAQHCCKFCMDDDVYRHAKSYTGECGRNYFSYRISSKIGSWTIHQEIFSSGDQGSSTGHGWLQNQRQAGAALQVHPKMGESCRARAAGIFRSEIVSASNPGEQLPGFFCAWKMKRKKKEQATSNMRQGTS